ncbi:MAG TPA: adenylate/guanylate cyclase domain-containing protein [Jatrophihabitantaceae bacterium]|nr:adenylate/guanylate cyclase domain-containing protein [Jatrophihabitantaceae bacterium]
MSERAEPSIVRVARVAHDATPWAKRTVLGVGAVVIAANLVGGVVVTFLLASLNASAPRSERMIVLTFAIVYVIAALLAGSLLGAVLHRRTLRWLLLGKRPTEDEAHRALRTPLDLALITGGFWVLGGISIGSLVAGLGAGADNAFGVGSGLVLGGLTTSAVTYVLVARFSRPVTELALATHPRGDRFMLSVRSRLLLNWLFTTGIPLLGIILILASPEGRRHVRGAGIALAVVALAVGVLSNTLAARAIGTPLRELVAIVRRVGEGDLDLDVIVDDAGEIGMLQDGVNDMVAGLRERDRVHDLFGRHVGPAVAREALEFGVTLSGEQRDVVALFVDITGSTALTKKIEPSEFVKRLNRFFSVVVSAVEDAGGLVNKFEGDAALCVFGAPVAIDDAATAALRTGRRIHAEVRGATEFDVGIGIASGRVIAGQIGSESRLEYTVIGDAVNEASRLTDIAKDEPSSVLAAEPVVLAATEQERAQWHFLREVTLRGRGGEPTRIWARRPLHEPLP